MQPSQQNASEQWCVAKSTVAAQTTAVAARKTDVAETRGNITPRTKVAHLHEHELRCWRPDRRDAMRIHTPYIAPLAARLHLRVYRPAYSTARVSRLLRPEWQCTV